MHQIVPDDPIEWRFGIVVLSIAVNDPSGTSTMRRLALILVLSALTGCMPTPGMGVVPPGPKPAPLGTGYGPVHADHLMGEHRFFATGRSGNQFAVSMDQQTVTFAELEQPLPPELLTTVLGPGRSARVIRGRWTLTGNTLKLSEITADETDGYPDVDLNLFRTPVVRTVFGEVQYVLAPR